mmetsp:Transcript_934/g.1140  ORF Transcript_934/g.1140 Transcript_934/m.1140 type:complete len:294 (-) Transcript_934:819-1700(-)
MTDIEERILKKNIPGKYSTWGDSDSDDKEHSGTDDNDDSYDYGNNASHRHNFLKRNEDMRKIQSHDVGKHRTGVKGVLEDHRLAKELENKQHEVQRKLRAEEIRRITQGSLMKQGEVSISLESQMQNKHSKRENEDNSSQSSDESFDDDDDDELINSYKQMRLVQLQNNALPEFGHLSEIQSALQFSAIIDESDIRVYCVFHLYSDNISSCRLLNHYLIKLAKEMKQCRFFKMRMSLVREDFDPIGYPCVLVYKGGKEVANLTPITTHFDSLKNEHDFTFDDVKDLLQSNIRG